MFTLRHEIALKTKYMMGLFENSDTQIIYIIFQGELDSAMKFQKKIDVSFKYR